MPNPKVLLCELCLSKFSENDVVDLNYFPEQQICFNCYVAGRKKDPREWCFGKMNETDPRTGTIKHYGYDPQRSSDCRKYCADRKICHLFATRRIDQFRMLIRSRIPYRTGTISARAYVSCVIGTTKKKLQDLVTSLGGDPQAMLEKFQRGRLGSIRWKFIESEDGKIKIRL